MSVIDALVLAGLPTGGCCYPDECWWMTRWHDHTSYWKHWKRYWLWEPCVFSLTPPSDSITEIVMLRTSSELNVRPCEWQRDSTYWTWIHSKAAEASEDLQQVVSMACIDLEVDYMTTNIFRNSSIRGTNAFKAGWTFWSFYMWISWNHSRFNVCVVICTVEVHCWLFMKPLD